MKTIRYRAHEIELSANDRKENLLRLSKLNGELPPECLAPEASVPDVHGHFPSSMRPIDIRWGNGTKSQHFVYKERLLLRKNQAPIAQYFEDIGAIAGTKLVIQQIGTFEFAICELAES